MTDQTLDAVVLGQRIWSGVSWRERRRIMDAVKHDELIRDPEEADKVVRVAGRVRRKKRRPGLLFLFGVLAVVASELVHVVADVSGGGCFPLLIAAAVIGSKVWEYVEARRWWDRWLRAEARHLDYLRQLGAPAWRFSED